MTLRILTVAVRTELDVLVARQRARQITSLCGFNTYEEVRIATVVSELARNIFNYAVPGKVEFFVSGEARPQTLVIRFTDQGPGIRDLDTIRAGQYQSMTGMGLGILSAIRLMDECDITTERNVGTTIVLKRIVPAGAPLLTAALIGTFGAKLNVLQDNVALSEARQQNKDLIDALEALKVNQDRLMQLTQELQATNDAVVALNAQLDEKATLLQRADLRKDEFLAILSHELRNPLAATSMAAGILEMPAVAPAKVAELGQLITRQTGHMSRLVEDLLDVSRVTRGLVAIERVPVDMRAVVQSAIEQVAPLIKRKAHSFVSGLPEDQCLVVGDQTRLVQVVANLLSNAARYTPDGGRITVSLLSDARGVTLQVVDNGVGIDAELLPRLFDLYVQAERSVDGKNGGLGLGLTLVKSIVELHDGTIIAASAGKGQGSTFEVRLPLLS